MALIYDLADPQELQGFVRAVAQEEERNRFHLSQFLPNTPLDDFEFRITQGDTSDEDAAFIRAWDTESPIGDRKGLSRLMGELPPISKKYRLGEEDRLRRRSLERNGDIKELVSAIFNDAAKGARAVAARIELLRGEALYTGKIVINENGVKQTVDFGRIGTHDPAALAGGAKWDAASTSTPVQDVRGWVDLYLATNGVKPAVILTSTKVLGKLLLNDQIRTLAGSLAGTPALVTEDTVRNVFSAFGLPPFYLYDTSVRVSGSQVKVIPDDKVIFLPPANEPLGRTFSGTTAEALELASAAQISVDQAPGMVSVVEKTFDPVATWTKTAAIALPVLANPNLTLVADVI